jgi:diguanylate cyclase (GGDEF)-like protein/PAS domain S-box-containing protein
MKETNVLTYGQIVLAAETLLRQGIEPDVKNVQKALLEHGGSQGPVEVIAKHLETWQYIRQHPTEIEQLVSTHNPIQDTSSQSKTASSEGLENIVSQRTEELKQSLALVKATLESTADGIMMLSNEGNLIDWNQKFVEILRIPPHILEDRNANAGVQYVFDQIKDPEPVYRQIAYLFEHPDVSGDMGNVALKDGRIIERYSQPHVVDGKIVGRVWSFRDITKRYRAEEALRLRNRAIEASPSGVIISEINDEQHTLYVNPAFEKFTGYSQEDMLGQSFEVIFGDDQGQPEISSLHLSLQEKTSNTVILRCYRKDGSLFWGEIHVAPVSDNTGETNYFVSILSDITLRKRMEEQLEHQATHDALTNLPNRLLLLDRIEQTIIQAKRTHELFALIFIDLDHFKVVNDSMGHPLGDLLLKAVAERIFGILREADTISRLGGDEFVVLVSGLDAVEKIIPIANKILKSIERPFIIQDCELNVTASLGISFYPKDGHDVNTLLKSADMSMYQAKNAGRDNYQFFTSELNDLVQHRMLIENSVPHALTHNEFILHYQPIVNLATGKMVGIEALIRWQHPELGFIAPDKFIDIIENSHYIRPVTKWVLTTACQQMKQLEAQGHQDLTLSVNFSGNYLAQENILKLVHHVLKETEMDPKKLHFEMTERVLLTNTDAAIQLLNSLRKIGIEISIDDFGTGYSSLSYLRLFPASTLKIDRSFVSEVHENADEHSIALIDAIIAIAHSMKLDIVAEGVETAYQAQFLKERGCGYAQGYYFSKPLAFDKLVEYAKK